LANNLHQQVERIIRRYGKYDQTALMTVMNVILADFCLSRLRQTLIPTLHALFRSAGRTNLTACRLRRPLLSHRYETGRTRSHANTPPHKKTSVAYCCSRNSPAASTTCRAAYYAICGTSSGVVSAIHDALTMDEQRRSRNHKESGFVMRNAGYISLLTSSVVADEQANQSLLFQRCLGPLFRLKTLDKSSLGFTTNYRSTD
jgi:hypothetical protein